MSMSDAIRRIKSRLTDEMPPKLIRRFLGTPERAHRLDPVVTALLFARQVLKQNCSIRRLRRLGPIDFGESAYCRACQRLAVGGLWELAGHLARSGRPPREGGRRTWLIDGTGFSMPDTDELAQRFGRPHGQAEGCGFPAAHLLCLFDASDGSIGRAVYAEGDTHDMASAALTHPAMRRGDVLVGDRAFCSYAHFALLRKQGMHGVFRAHQRLAIGFGRRHGRTPASMRRRVARRLGPGDQLVEYRKPAERPDWMDPEGFAGLPGSMTPRELRYRVRPPARRVREVTLVTTLTDPERDPAAQLAAAYARRWQAEVDLRDLKVTLGLDVLKCHTVAGVQRELAMMLIVYDLVRRVLGRAAKRQGEEPDRLSFIDGLDWLAEARSGEEIPELKVNPARDRPAEPRVRKRRPKQYPLMKRPRHVLKAELNAA